METSSDLNVYICLPGSLEFSKTPKLFYQWVFKIFRLSGIKVKKIEPVPQTKFHHTSQINKGRTGFTISSD